MSVSTYIPDSTKILHIAYADFVSRQIGRTIHVVQYDDNLPLLAVKLFSDGQPYTIPSNAEVSIKLGKSDGKFVYNPTLGCDSTRQTAYFEITYQMVVLAETVSPVIEVRIGSYIAASSSIGIIIDRNPIQREDIESTSEWKVIGGAVDYAKEAIAAAANASASRSAAKTSETNAASSASTATSKASEASNSAKAAKTSEANAKTSETNAASSASTATSKASEASNSAKAAKTSETSAASSASTASDYAQQSKSYAVGGTDTRPNESIDNSEYYYEQCKTISESFAGALRPMGTVTFANLPILANTVEGDMYNISDQFVTTSSFKEGAGNVIPAGSNVYKTYDGYWDVLAGSPVTGVKGSAENNYRKGNVDITKDNIGLGNVGNFKAVSTVASQGLTDAEKVNARNNINALSADGNTASATKLQTARTIDGVSFNGSAAITHYGSCSTAAATAAKVVSCTGFMLVTGAVIRVKFTTTNTAANPTLNVNSTGAKQLYYRGSAISAGYLAANRTYEFVYNGSQYDLIGDIDTNTTYSSMKGATSSAAGTAGLVPAPVSGKQTSFLRGDGTWTVPANTTYSFKYFSTSNSNTSGDVNQTIITVDNGYTAVYADVRVLNGAVKVNDKWNPDWNLYAKSLSQSGTTVTINLSNSYQGVVAVSVLAVKTN